MEKRTAILFGSTGLVGNHLLGELIKEDAYKKIILFNRKPIQPVSTKVEEIITDFTDLQKLESLITGDDMFCCLGTTIKKAKTQERFRQVDYGLPVTLAEIASRKQVTHFMVVSSIGSNAKSNNFYLRTKGEMEEAIIRILGKKAYIVRPSILLGKRNEYRFGEEVGKWFARLLTPLFIGRLARYKSIQASDVARAMLHIALHGSIKQIIESDELQKLSKRYNA
ncbi:MAG: NAD(P)H-binding protein [Bacteroidales bacterium]|nr:NAD(P)H-binding protein [Bacteroidales bacterium]